MLVIGLGGTGARVASRLKGFAARAGVDRSRLRILAIDQGQNWSFGKDGSEDLSLDRGECFHLPGEAARMIGRYAASWKLHLGWLQSRGLRQLDEILVEGAGGQRWLGRLGFFAADREIGDALRSMVWAGQADRILLVCSASGGTGSGLLADMTYLLERVAPGVPRLLYLLLPPTGDGRVERGGANTYAVLREVFHLKYQGIPFQARYPHLGSLSVPAHSCEAWKRIYLFRSSAGERPPFHGTVDRIALSMTAQLEARLYAETLSATEREAVLGELDQPLNGLEGRCFSACGTFGEGLSSRDQDLRVLVRAAGLQPVPSVPPVARALEPEPREPALPAGSKAKLLYEILIGRAIGSAADRLIAEVEERTLQLPEVSREAKGQSLGRIASEARELSRVIGPLPVRNVAEKTPGLFARLRHAVSPRKSKLVPAAVERIEEGRSLDALNTWPVARQELLRGVQEYLASFSEGELAQRELARLALEAREERIRRGVVLPDRRPAYEDLLTRWRDLLARARGGDGSEHEQQIEIEDCCNALRAIVHRPEFRLDLERYLESQIDLVTPMGLSAQSVLQSAPVQSEPGRTLELAAVQESGGVDAPSQLSADNGPSAGWQSVIDMALEQCNSEEEPVFSKKRTPPGSRRIFAIAVLPDSMAQEGGEGLNGYLMEKVKELDPICECRIVRAPEGRFWFHYEDLFHSPCDIANLEEYEKAYQEEQDREKLHIDVRFLTDPLFTDLCMEAKGSDAKQPCGNPGCQHSIRDLPPEETICPGCRRPIRSRCGNAGCSLVDLRLHPQRQSVNCPGCHQFNHGAWWKCELHGKIETLVSNDHAVCPECVKRHEADPEKYPVSSIGVRPDLRQTMPW